MGTPLTETVIITGGNGLLGSEIAVEIAKKQPFVHLSLTARDIRTDDVRELMGKIRLVGPRSIEVLALDLTDLKSVASFAKTTVDRVRYREIPPVTSLIHSAVATSYVIDDLTSDGYDPVYQTNCLSPFLLTIGLLEAFRAGDGTPKGGAKVINIGCSAISSGRLDYFDRDNGRNGRRPGTALSAKEENIRFGSSKLMASVALYALRRSLIWTGNISIDVFTLDPGGITGPSNLRTGAPMSVRVAHQTRSGLRPFLRMVSRSSMNKVSVPAKAITRVAFHVDAVENWQKERYFILDSDYEAASVLPSLRDERQVNKLLLQMMQMIDVETKDSPPVRPQLMMNRHVLEKGYSAYPRGSAFSISPNRYADSELIASLFIFRTRSPVVMIVKLEIKTDKYTAPGSSLRLCLLGAVSLVVFLLIFPSWRAAILPSISLGLLSYPGDLHLQTVRYYDLSEVQGTEKGWERGERVLMCTPLRDASSHLPMFFSHLRNLTYPHHLIDLAFLVSDSRDDTLNMLSHMLEEIQNDPDPKMPFGEISVIQKDFGQKVQQDVESRHGFEAQASRRKLMAQARNWLLSATLRPTHSWVYWRDADVETAPFTIIEDLMRHNKDVTVPNVWRPLPDWLGGEQPYDLNSWQESETALALADTLDEDAVIVEGYAEYATWRPHLAYLRDPYGDPDMEMELDGIGGVSILAKARVFRAGVHFPAFSFEKHAETEGFGKMAKRMKFSVVGLPHYTIWHLYEPSVDDLRHMEQMEVERLAREKEEQERAEQKDNVQSKPLGTDQDVDGAEGHGSTEDLAGQPVKAVDSTQGHLKAQAETVDQAEKVEVVEKAKL
ncbi:Anp1 [Penicillium griseofulvum]|uniref:Anp1 n=1 Tax=Penicillium patulum TaxID=5078 RepID=A0A135LFP7_PENPA|nr:Anp1 [Penicillium griseofulvum]KXG47802.1 Anp1 [Penicillium griseofulvum]